MLTFRLKIKMRHVNRNKIVYTAFLKFFTHIH
nr:MAG TPA: hypothetical protein [Caudoviricetes sp.]